jgi:required for meiotic nuclear division protein 1
MTAIALDGRIDLVAATQRLAWGVVRHYAYGVAFDVEEFGRVFLFDFGAVVVDGVNKIPPALSETIEKSVGRKPLLETEETYKIAVDPERSGPPRVGWDQVVVPSREPGLISAMALLLGQSAAIERYEKAADDLIEAALPPARFLADRGRVPGESRALIQRIGRLTTDRLELANLFYLLDRPEETWEDARIAQLYDGLFSNLELKERHLAMLNKLEAVERVTDLTLNIWLGHLSNRLEWAIVVLIIVELVLAVFKLV